MKPTPMILGAIALAIGAGTALGMSTPTEPLSHYSDTLDSLPQHAMETRNAEQTRKMVAPIDQYPLETPDAVIAVPELVFHGRLREQTERQARFAARMEREELAMHDAAYGIDYRAYEQARALEAQQPMQPARGARLDEVRMEQAGFVPLEDGIFERRTAVREIPARAEQATHFARRDAMIEGKARVIDVEAELAARN